MLTRIICFAHCEDVEIRPAEKKNVLIMSNQTIKHKLETKKQIPTTKTFYRDVLSITLTTINFQAQKLRQIWSPSMV